MHRQVRVINPHRPRTSHTYYWVWAELQDGRHGVLGPFNDHNEAYQQGFSKSNGQFEVVPLPTSNRQRATEMLKAKYLGHDGVKMDEALQRVRHQ